MIITRNLIGRFGNQCMQYLHVRAYAEAHDCELQTSPWVGQQIFELDEPPIGFDLPEVNDTELAGQTDICITGYAQHQGAMIYSQADARRWLRFRPEIQERLEAIMDAESIMEREDVIVDEVVAHHRKGDYANLGYPIVSMRSYYLAGTEHGLNMDGISAVSDSWPWMNADFRPPIDFLPDFYRLVKAPILLRGNSSFSWVAAVLGEHKRVFSPVVDGLGAGEHDVPFVEGNWPRFCSLPFVTDLHLKNVKFTESPEETK